jgi:branched-chain amino acid aminotransferase
MSVESFLPIAYFQNHFIPFAVAKLSIATHALHYGTGAIAGLRGIPNPENASEILLFRMEKHCQRLSKSAQVLHMNLSAAEIKSVLLEFIQRNRPTVPFYIRPLVYTSSYGSNEG